MTFLKGLNSAPFYIFKGHIIIIKAYEIMKYKQATFWRPLGPMLYAERVIYDFRPLGPMFYAESVIYDFR